MTFKAFFERKWSKGEALAISCGRGQYAGIVGEVYEDYIVLTNVFFIEASGLPDADMPSSAIKIVVPIIMPLNAIRYVYEPNWLVNLMKYKGREYRAGFSEDGIDR